jgi:hypothetical protein
MISRNVKTSQIFGTLLSFIFHLTSSVAAKTGSAAFLEPLILTIHFKSLEVFILYIFYSS